MHTVTQGQGLYSISRMYGVTEDEIIKLNPGSEKVIKTGQELRIPNKKPSATSGKFHTVQKGETLFRLAVQNRISVKELCDANPGLSADNFKIGQVITIPAPSDKDPLASTIENAGDNAPQHIKADAQTIQSDTAVLGDNGDEVGNADELERETVGGTQDDVLVRAQLAQRAVLLHNGHLIAELERRLLIVRDVEDRRAQIALDLADLEQHLLAQLGVEVGDRLVHDDDFAVADEGAGYGDALLLTARKLAGQVVGVFDHLHLLKRVMGALERFVLGDMAQLKDGGL